MDDTQAGRRMRLIEFKNTLKIKNIAFSKRLKTNPGFLSQLLNGHRNITESFAYQVGKCYSGFNPDWLITGNGEMFFGKEEGLPPPEQGVLTGVMEPEAPVYKRDQKIALEDLAGIIARLQAEVEELRGRVERLEGKG